MSISLLLPTRKRPANLRRMVASARNTAVGSIDFSLYIEPDDPETVETAKSLHLPYLVAPKIILSDRWNKCFENASSSSEIFMLCADDLIFQTYGWDEQVKSIFNLFPDRIAFVYGDDLHLGTMLGTHGFVHRRWIETLGYFTPPYFPFNYVDVWLNEVAGRLGRRIYLPIIIEHLHYQYGEGKAPVDETYQLKIEQMYDNPRLQALYEEKALERDDAVRKLFLAIAHSQRFEAAA